MSNIGFRILPPAPQAPREWIEALRGIVTAHLSDNMNRLKAVSSDIRPYHDKTKLVGTAFTVKVPPVVSVVSSVTLPVPLEITAASLVPLIVTVTEDVVPSTDATVKVSVSV